jgi:Domain of unknown function (DUF4234)
MSTTAEGSTPAAGSRPIGQQRGSGFVIVMSIVTLGIYAIYWFYKTFQEVRNYRGEGVGGLGGVLLAFIIVSYFLLPQYVGKMHAAEGKPAPVSGMSGFWILVPYAGAYILMYKIQEALNAFWASKGALPPGTPAEQPQASA